MGMPIWGKWPWQRTTKGLGNSTELQHGEPSECSHPALPRWRQWNTRHFWQCYRARIVAIFWQASRFWTYLTGHVIMAGHRSPGRPDGALAFFGGRRMTRWRFMERGGWLADGRRGTQTSDSIFASCCWYVILNVRPFWCVDEVTVQGRIAKIIMQYRFPLSPPFALGLLRPWIVLRGNW